MLGGLPACEEKKTSAPETASSAKEAPEKAPVLGGRLGQAVQAAVSSAAGAGQPPAQGSGPPPNGILGEARAKTELPAGTASKLEIFSTGAEPRVRLPAAVPAGKTVLLVSAQLGGQAIPTIELTLDWNTDAAGLIRGRVTKAAMAPQQPGRLPPDAAKEIAKLAGSTLSWTRSAAESGAQVNLGPGAQEGLAATLESAAEMCTLWFAMLPDAEVGKGATWMRTERTKTLAGPVVRYAGGQLLEVSPSGARIAVDVREYAIDASVNLPWVPRDIGAQLDTLLSTSHSELTFVPGQGVPKGLTSRRDVQMQLIATKRENQPFGLQFSHHIEQVAANP